MRQDCIQRCVVQVGKQFRISRRLVRVTKPDLPTLQLTRLQFAAKSLELDVELLIRMRHFDRMMKRIDTVSDGCTQMYREITPILFPDRFQHGCLCAVGHDGLSCHDLSFTFHFIYPMYFRQSAAE